MDLIILSREIVIKMVLAWDIYCDKVITICKCLDRVVNSETQAGHKLEAVLKVGVWSGALSSTFWRGNICM